MLLINLAKNISVQPTPGTARIIFEAVRLTPGAGRSNFGLVQTNCGEERGHFCRILMLVRRGLTCVALMR